jgi:hypothetical protein
MLRSAEQIVSQTEQLTENFVTKYYDIASRQQRGISFKDNFNMDNILLRSLDQNAIFDTLTERDQSNIIDTLIS